MFSCSMASYRLKIAAYSLDGVGIHSVQPKAVYGGSRAIARHLARGAWCYMVRRPCQGGSGLLCTGRRGRLRGQRRQAGRALALPSVADPHSPCQGCPAAAAPLRVGAYGGAHQGQRGLRVPGACRRGRRQRKLLIYVTSFSWGEAGAGGTTRVRGQRVMGEFPGGI